MNSENFNVSNQTSKGAKDLVQKGPTDTVYDKGQPRGLWKVGRIERVIQGPEWENSKCSNTCAVQEWTTHCVEVTCSARVFT